MFVLNKPHLQQKCDDLWRKFDLLALLPGGGAYIIKHKTQSYYNLHSLDYLSAMKTQGYDDIY
jgi:hypothetical protein